MGDRRSMSFGAVTQPPLLTCNERADRIWQRCRPPCRTCAPLTISLFSKARTMPCREGRRAFLERGFWNYFLSAVCQRWRSSWAPCPLSGIDSQMSNVEGPNRTTPSHSLPHVKAIDRIKDCETDPPGRPLMEWSFVGTCSSPASSAAMTTSRTIGPICSAPVTPRIHGNSTPFIPTLYFF